MTPFLTYPNTHLTVVNKVWHGVCCGQYLTMFNTVHLYRNVSRGTVQARFTGCNVSRGTPVNVFNTV